MPLLHALTLCIHCDMFQLPMVLKVHRFEHSVSTVCGRPYALLGFGDIVVPGDHIYKYDI